MTTDYSALNMELVTMQKCENEQNGEFNNVSGPTTCNNSSSSETGGGSAIYPVLDTATTTAVAVAVRPKVGDMCCFNKREKALKRCRVQLKAVGGDRMNLATFKEAFTQQVFLDNLFQLFDVNENGQLDQDEFLDYFYKRLKDDRGQQFCEVIETATFAIAPEEPLRSETFSRIFSTKGLLDKLFRLMDKNGDNFVTINEAVDLIAKLTMAQSHTSLTKENLEYLSKVFAENCNENNEITLDRFRKIIHSKNVFFTDRVFSIFDRDGSGTVSMQEFLDAVSKFSGQSMEHKIKFLFDIYDQDGDGLVQMEELRHVMKACMDENGMKFSEEQLDDLTTALFEDADPEDTGAITVDSLKSQMEKHDGILENLSNSIEKWLVPPKPVEKTFFQKVIEMKPHQLSWSYLKNNYAYLLFLFLFAAFNVALFTSRMWQYRDSNIYVQLARGCGQCLNFTCMFILVLMLRKCITWLRTHGVSKVLPLDEHIYLHKLTGWLIFMYSAVHTVMHIANLAVIAESKKEDVGEFIFEWLFSTKSGIGWIYGTAFPTGVALLVILIIMFVCSQPCVRQNGKFEVFYWTHRLYIIFFILCFVHGPRFWQWFLVPGIIFTIELIVRFYQRRSGHGSTNIAEAVLLPSKVTHLVIKRPPNFHFRPGDYVFIKIPTIAKYEWHPFTVSSAPEQEDVIWLHIRGVGEWTNQLFTHFDKQLKRIAEAQLAAANEAAPPEPITKRRSIFSRGSRFLRSSARFALGSNGDARLVSGTDGVDNMAYLNTDNELIDSKGKKGGNISMTGDGENMVKPLTKQSGRQRIGSTKSLPILDAPTMRRSFNVKPHKGLSRSSSHQIGSLKEKQLAEASTNFSTTSNVRMRSKGQSFRHMRRKPRVIPMSNTLSATVIEEEEETQEEEDVVAPSEVPQTLNSLTVEGETAAVEKSSPVTNNKSAHNEPTKVVVESEDTTMTSITIEVPQPVVAVVQRNSFTPLRLVRSCEPFCGEKPLEVFIDGPYGAPSSHIFRAEHAVLVGTGIGVTPFASILQSIMRRYWEARQTCPKCSHNFTSEVPSSYLNLKKVDFFWINRDQKSFEWFVNLLTELEIEQAEQGGVMERFLDMHMYITSALQKTDMKAVGLHMALDLLHEKEKRDLITGLKTRTQAGRPNWNKVFRQIAQQKKGKVTVFFCGQPLLARTLKLKCDEFGFSFKKEVF